MTALTRPRRSLSQISEAPTFSGWIARNPVGLLFLMCVFLITFIGVYWYAKDINFNFKMNAFTQSELSEDAQRAIDNRFVNRKFVMGGVQLGMTVETIQSIYPDAQVSFDRNDAPVLTARTPNGVLVAWLYAKNDYILVKGAPVHDQALRVFRLRLDEAVATIDEQQIISRYAVEYGRPIDTTCERAGLGDTARCTYNWWGGDGIELQVIAKEKVNTNGKPYTQLITIASDTVTIQKFQAIPLAP